jgi:hypothetical protein
MNQIDSAIRRDLIDSLPNVSSKDLDSLNKGDALVKFLAMVQVSWLIIQLIARKIARLPSSQLEIAALAFSASSLITYLLFWNHPQGVETIIKVSAKRLPSPSDVINIARLGPRYLWTGERTRGKICGDMDLVPIPNDATHGAWQEGYRTRKSKYHEATTLVFGAILGGTVFGGLHCLAWNYHFPTQTELLLWRISSTLMASLPIISIPFTVVWLKYNSPSLERSPWTSPPVLKRYATAGTLIVFFAVPYALARLFVIVEMFRSLLFLPPEVFIETWSGTFPHWG